VRGQHQIGVGGEFIHNRYDSRSFLAAAGNVTFTGQVTGLGLADFLLGRAASFNAGTLTGVEVRSHYTGLYVQDNWRLSPHVTLNLGLRWEPYLPVYSDSGRITHFDRNRFDRGIRSTVFPNAPPGLMFPGDEGMPGKSLARNDYWNFAPRVGVVWDPDAEGRQTLRAAYGRLYDLPHLQTFSSLAQMAPWGNTVTVNNLPAGWDDPWIAVPGGDPIPALLGGPNRDTRFPLFANYTTFPLDLPATSTDQWNVSYQRQVATDWMISANYLGNVVKHVWTANQINPAVFGPGATVGNTSQRRVLFRQNPADGQFFGSIQALDPYGTSNYHGLLLSVQRRRAGGFSLQGNYTVSRCQTDRWNQEPGVSGAPYVIPDNRRADRGRCPNSPEQSVNVSLVYRVPDAGTSRLAQTLTSGWQVSAIVSARSGSYFSVVTGVDNALSGQPNQRANQILTDPFVPGRTFERWLNPAAFEAPAPGTYGTMPIDAIPGPGRWNVDAAVTRSLPLGSHQVQFRMEAFNLFNTVNPGNPVSNLSSPDFGQITSLAGGTAPRILQLAVKYQF
jgi:outer membrane receptor protein involved in Fe transport